LNTKEPVDRSPGSSWCRNEKAEGDIAVCLGCGGWLLTPYLHLTPGRRPKIKAVPKEKGRSGKGIRDHDDGYWLSCAGSVKKILLFLVLFH
jgi:hypothetical protein